MLREAKYLVIYGANLCTTNYVMTTKNGQTIVTQGKPQLDKETGMTSYTDQEGNQREINSNDVAQLIKAD
ncbi:YgdI/YgdR family lipoprotein [Salmonella enterica subsp. enterica serovar Weltevreden]|nr:YgdI/YgdR family lipoprotein [Salmonella enterica subsp. enterica serovar Weltevreden]